MRNLIVIHRNYKKDIIVITIIVLTPFLFFLYNFAPNKVPIWETQWFRIDAGVFEDVNYYLWMYCTKLLIIVIVSVWFITCKHWWRYFLLIPLSIELMKIQSIFNDVNLYLDSFNYLKSLPISIVYMSILIFISKQFNYYSRIKSFNHQLDNEINILMQKVSSFKTDDYTQTKRELINLRKQKNQISKKEYLKKLIALRDRNL